MDVVALWTALIVMFLSLHMHEIKLVHQTVSLEQAQSTVDGYSINVGIETARTAQELAGIQMLFGGFDHPQDRSALTRHAQAARHQFGLKTSRGFRLG